MIKVLISAVIILLTIITLTNANENENNELMYQKIVLKDDLYNKHPSLFIDEVDDVNYITLNSGVNMTGQIGGSGNPSVLYYKFNNPKIGGDIEITITPIFGDPDIFVTTSNEAPPSPSNNMWASRSFGADAILIQSDDAHYCDDCEYYMVVVAYMRQKTSYIIEAVNERESGDIVLTDGVSQFFSVATGYYQYYKFNQDKVGETLSISVNAITGDPDVYVSADTDHPSPTDYTWKGINYGSDMIVIPHTNSSEYYIGIYGSFSNATGYITASSENAIELIDGHAEIGEVAQFQTQYYNFTVMTDPNSKKSTTVKLTLIVNNGLCSMFLATGYKPTFAKNDLITDAVLVEQMLQVEQNMSDTRTGCTVDRCVYEIGVMGVNGTCQYHLTPEAIEHDSSGNTTGHTDLETGVPYLGLVEENQIIYFAWENLNRNSATFQLTCTEGDADLFVSLPSSDNPYPNINESDYESRFWGNDSIELSSDEMEHGTFFIGVEGYSRAHFSLVVFYDGEETVLYNGIPQNGFVKKHEYKYYEFTFDAESANLDFSLTNVQNNNDAILLIGIGEKPTIFSNLYHSKENILIQHAPSRTYIVGVYGYKATDYTVEVVVSGAIAELEQGELFHNTIVNDEWQYYMFYVDEWENEDEVITIVLSSETAGKDPDVYASVEYPHPNRTNAQWSSQSFGNEALIIQHPSKDNNSCTDCYYFLGTRSFNGGLNYSIGYAAPPINQLIVPSDLSIRGDVIAAMYYRIYIDDDTDKVTITVQISWGNDLGMYASKDAQYPDEDNKDWVATESSNTLTIEMNSDDKLCNDCWIYIGVINHGDVRGSYSIKWTTD